MFLDCHEASLKIFGAQVLGNNGTSYLCLCEYKSKARSMEVTMQGKGLI